HLGLYYYYKTQKEKPGFINRRLYKKFGEKPVYQSDVETYKIEDLLLNLLENRSFFYSSAASAFEETDKKASLKYKVKVSDPYRSARYPLDSLPASIEGNMQQSVSESPFREDIRFDLGNMKLERNRIDR